MRVFVATVMVAVSLGTWGCGSGGYGGSPGAPSPTPAPSTSGVVTINIVAENGALSFSPNPATLPAGQTVVWHNVDNQTHRVVLNNGGVDTGNLGPGASSQAMTINTGGASYHCSIHPSMVGTIVPATAAVN